MKPWTVISYDEETGQVLGDLVEADDEWGAFAATRALREDILSLITFIAAIEGKHMVCPPTESGDACVAIDYPEAMS